MARTEIEKQSAALAGSEVVFGAVTAAAAPNGHYFETDGNDIVLVKNSGAGSNTMTVKVPVLVDGTTSPDRVVTIPAGKTYQWRPRPDHRQTLTGQVHVNFSHATEVTVAILS